MLGPLHGRHWLKQANFWPVAEDTETANRHAHLDSLGLARLITVDPANIRKREVSLKLYRSQLKLETTISTQARSKLKPMQGKWASTTTVCAGNLHG
jgi:hypothetical protein